MIELNKIVSGPGATNSDIENALRAILQEQMQLANEARVGAVTVGAEIAKAQGQAVYDSQVAQSNATLCSAVGDIVSSAANGAAEGIGNFGGSYKDQINEQNTIIKNVEEAQTAVKNADATRAITNSSTNATGAVGNPVVDNTGDHKALIKKLQDGTAKDFAKDPHDVVTKKNLIDGVENADKAKIESNLANIRKEAYAERARLTDERNTRIRNAQSVGQILSGLSRGSLQIGSSQYQLQQAQAEKERALLDFSSRATDAITQQLGTMWDGFRQAQLETLKNLDDAMFQQRG